MRRVKVLYMMRTPGYLRFHRSVLEELSKLGCRITVLFDRNASQDADKILRLPDKQEYPEGVEVDWALPGAAKHSRILRAVRNIRSYRRFLKVTGQGVFYKERWIKFLPAFLQFSISLAPRLSDTILKFSASGLVLKAIERLIPVHRGVKEEFLKRRVEVAVFAFRNMPAHASDVEYFKAAKKLGIPTVVLVSSWDSLTTKGLIPFEPERLLVWNERQINEAIGHHGINPSRIKVMGAYQFDDWFAFDKPSARSEFCRKFGLDAACPFILYIASGIITGDNIGVVEEIDEMLMNCGDEELKRLQIVVRPPLDSTREFGVSLKKGIVTVPRSYKNLSQSESRELFFDCVYHSVGVLALHTTGIIDALAKGKPGIVYLRAEQCKVQKAEHFTQLLKSGAVETVGGAAQLCRGVKLLLEGVDERREAREKFLRDCLRPHGLLKPVSPMAADCIVKLASSNRQIAAQ